MGDWGRRLGWIGILSAGLVLFGQLAPVRVHISEGTGWSVGPMRPDAPSPTRLLVRLAPGALSSVAHSRSAPKYELLERLAQREVSPLVASTMTDFAGPTQARLARTFVMQPPEGITAEAWLEKVRQDPGVEHAELNAIVRTQHANLPNDPFLTTVGSWGQAFQDLYGLHNIHAPEAWLSSTGAGVLVAVIDTGIDLRHPDLKANLWVNAKEIAGNGVDDDHNGLVDDVFGWDFVGADLSLPKPGPDPTDHSGHGTHVAGTVAAVAGNGIGVAGVAPDAKVMAIKALDDNGFGTIEALIQALFYAQAQGAKVANLSLGFQGTSEALHDAIKTVTEKGMVVVCGSGNGYSDVMDFCPAHFSEVITVGASHEGNYPYLFTNFGLRVDLLAPGKQVLSCRASGAYLGKEIGSGYCILDGTSMAAPHVSGVAALLLAQRPGLSIECLRQLLRTTAQRPYSIFDSRLLHGYGVVDAAAALAQTSTAEVRITGVPGFDGRRAADIVGLVRGSGLSTYTLEYGAGRMPTGWTLIKAGPVPQGSAVLGRLDPFRLPEGDLTLRLSTYSAAGILYQDHFLVRVSFVEITSPAPPIEEGMARQFKPGLPIPIRGYVKGQTGNYSVGWAPGVMPDQGWTSTGVELAPGAALPLEGRLATWTPPADQAQGYYTLRLAWQDETILRCAYSVIHLEPDLYSAAWPNYSQVPPQINVGWFKASDAAGRSLMALPLNNGFWGGNSLVERWRPEGTLVDRIVLPGGLCAQPLAGDLLPSTGLEAVLANGLSKLSTLRADGTLMPHLDASGLKINRQAPVGITLQNGTRALAQLALAASGSGGQLHLVRLEDGKPLPGFPVSLNGELNVSMVYSSPSQMTVGDMDGDGRLEFVIAQPFSDDTYEFQCVSEDGRLRPWGGTRHPGPLSGLALADLDGLGKLDLIHLDGRACVHVHRWDGSDRAGWPTPPTNEVPLGMAVGDVDGDGKPEVAVVSRKSLRLLKLDGTSMGFSWPLRIAPSQAEQFSNTLRVLDIDGDGQQEVIVVRLVWGERPWLGRAPYKVQMQSVFVDAYTRLGNRIRSWPISGWGDKCPYFLGTVTGEDWDGDGFTELALHMGLVARGGGMITEGTTTLLRTGAPWRPGTHDWPSAHGDAANRGLVRSDRTPPQVAILSPVADAVVWVGSTASVQASDNDGVAQVGLQVDGQEAPRVGSASGYVFALNGAMGRHTLRAWAKDLSGLMSWSSPREVLFVLAPSTVQLSLAVGPHPCTPVDRLRVKVQIQPPTATGMVHFSLGSALLGSATLEHGKAEWELPALTPGSHTVTARYSGDLLQASATSAPLSLDCFDFTLRADGETRMSGATSTTLRFIAQGPFPGKAELSCIGVPSDVTATLGALQQAADGSYSASLTVSLKTPLSLAGPIGGALLCLGLVRRRRRGPLAVVCACAGFGLLLACGGKGGSNQEAPKVRSLTVQATSGSLVRTCPVTVTLYR